MKNIIAVLSLLVLLTACAPADDVTPASQPEPVDEPQLTEDAMEESAGAGTVNEVPIRGFEFVPPTIVIKAGDTIRWTNEDNAPHDATGDGWSTSLLRKDQSDSVTFDTPGTYDYICSIHPYMKAKVVVE